MATSGHVSNGDVTQRKLKIAVLGEKQVGKTSLVRRYVKNIYNDVYIYTQGGDMSEGTVHINNTRVNITLIDSAGHNYQRSLIKSLYRDVHGIMIVYDVTKEKSLNAIDAWLEQIRVVNPYNPCMLLVGNKMDLKEYVQVPADRAKLYAEQRNLDQMQVSAKTGHRVYQAFSDLIQDTYRVKIGLIDEQQRGSIIYLDHQIEKEKTSCCS